MKAYKRLLALALCLMLALTGCTGGDTTWVYEQAGEQMPAGIYLAGMLQAYGQVWRDIRTNENPEPTKKEVLATDKDGTKADAWIAAEARSQAMAHYGIRVQAAQLGISLSTEEQQAQHNVSENIWSGALSAMVSQQMEQSYYSMMYGPALGEEYVMLTMGIPGSQQYLFRLDGAALEKNGISQSAFEEYLITMALKQKLFLAIYDKGGSKEVPDSELYAQMNEDYAKAYMLTLNKQSTTEALEEEETEEVKAAREAANAEALAKNEETRKLAEDYKSRLAAGEDIVSLELEYRETLEEEHGHAEGEEETLTPVDKESLAQLVSLPLEEEDADWAVGQAVAAAAVGEPVVIEDDYGIYVIVRVSLLEDEAELENMRQTLLESLKMEEFNADMEALGAEQNPVPNQKALDRYKPSGLKV